MWDKVIKWIFALGGAISAFYGSWSVTTKILVILMAADFISGWVVAIANKSPKTENGGLSSKIGFIGLAKKGFIMLIVLLATKLDQAVGNASMIFQTATVFYYIANEGLSVLENAELIGIPFPAFIKKHLESMKDEKNGDPIEKVIKEVTEDGE